MLRNFVLNLWKLWEEKNLQMKIVLYYACVSCLFLQIHAQEETYQEFGNFKHCFSCLKHIKFIKVEDF